MAGGPNNDGVDQARVRNIGLVGPRASGKTALTEAVLLENKAITRLGRVEDGSTVSDHTDVEKRLGHSVHLSVATTEVTDAEATEVAGPVRINLVDTPGHADFVGELRAGLRAADAALFVVSATDTARRRGRDRRGHPHVVAGMRRRRHAARRCHHAHRSAPG